MVDINWDNKNVARIMNLTGYSQRETGWQSKFRQGVKLAADGDSLLDEVKIAKELGFESPESRRVVVTIFGAAAKEGRRR